MYRAREIMDDVCDTDGGGSGERARFVPGVPAGQPGRFRAGRLCRRTRLFLPDRLRARVAVAQARAGDHGTARATVERIERVSDKAQALANIAAALAGRR